ncbi:MAG: DUF4340 domain-containing protein [Oscillospiraceae bacterium]|nr:DUF4340 domain-containing protein [Oscillospiraceae bacterium]
MKKKRFIIGGIAIVLLVAGIIFLTRYNPAKPEEMPKPTEDVSELVTVLELDTADEISVVSDELDITFINNDGAWEIDGVPADDVSPSKLAAFTSNALLYTTDTILTDADLSEYGLDTPSLTIMIKDGEETHTVFVGDKSAVDNVYFASADGVLFTMSYYQYSLLINDVSYYTEYMRLALGIDTISGVKIKTNDRTIDIYLPELTRYEGNVWQMREPYKTLASDTFMDENVLPQLASISLSEKADTIGDERAVMTVTDNGVTYEFKVGSSDGGSVYVEYEGRAYKEPAANFAFIDAETFSFVNKLVSYVNINDVSSYTVEFDGKSYKTDISGHDSELKFMTDGKDKDAETSRKLYSEVIGVVATGLYNGESLGETIMKVTFKGLNGAPDSVVEYKQVNEYTAAVIKDGQTIFVTGIADVNNLKDKLKEN